MANLARGLILALCTVIDVTSLVCIVLDTEVSFYIKATLTSLTLRQTLAFLAMTKSTLHTFRVVQEEVIFRVATA